MFVDFLSVDFCKSPVSRSAVNMSTTYSATTKDSSKDKDSTDTYVRSSTETSDTSKTTGKNKTNLDSDKTHDNETSQYGKTGTSISSNTQYGVQSRGQQYGQGGNSNQQEQEYSTRQQSEIQQKLKEVGNLLQKAGHLLQDLQGSSGDFQVSSQWSRNQGGNYTGPYGFESQHQGQYNQPQSSQYGPSSSQWNHPSSSQYGQGPSYRFEGDRAPVSRFNEDREFGSSRGFSGRPEDRFDARHERGNFNTDRFGGFGGPNRPDLAYGEQYGAHASFGTEGRRGADLEFSRQRGNNSRW